MFVVFNILIVFMILLIAYWWANQGLFSALLHLICVIIAGVVALAVWEPITVNYLLGVKTLGDYAWGITLVTVFVVVGLILRIITNKVIPANVQVPHWANLTFGGALGAVAGVFSVGIVMIGGGYLQSSTEIMGFTGLARDSRTGSIPETPQRPWIPAHEWTYQALSLLSDTSLSTSTPLAEYNPHIDYMAASLLRDTYKDGRGKATLDPDDATLERYQLTPDNRMAAVTFSFRGAARDFGEMLTLSKSQVRLILDSGRAVHPFGWAQRTANSPNGNFLFDDVSHYATSVPGADNATITFKFNIASSQDSYGGDGSATGTPRFIQVRGTRFRLPAPQSIAPGEIITNLPNLDNTSTAAPPSGGTNFCSAITQGARLRSVNISKNQLVGMNTVEGEEGFYLSKGQTEIKPGGVRPGRNLRINGIHEPPGTRVLQINVARNSPANLFDRSISANTSDGDQIKLMDAQNRTYTPIGYVHRRPDQTIEIKLNPEDGVSTMSEIPSLPTSGNHQLDLIFRVTEGITLQALMIGDVTVGTCSMAVETD